MKPWKSLEECIDKEPQEDGARQELQEEASNAAALHSRGWQRLQEGRHLEALADFCLAIELDPNCAEAYNKRGIMRQLLGQDLEGDFGMADDLSRDDAAAHEQLLLARKWQPVGWKDGRTEAQGETQAKDADFLISFASPDSGPNNKILHQLKQGVLFDGKTGPVRFCTDRSLGMGVHVVPGKASQRWDPKYSNLDDPRQPGDFPNWFKHYKEAAEGTKHGILILQLTESYFKSKACRWEFGYIRKPELVHVFIDGVDGPKIVHWQDLMQDADLCSRAFGVEGASPASLQQAADIMVSQLVKTDLVHETVAAAAKLVEEQEYQAWCALPLREVAYVLTRNQEKTADGIVAANELLAVYQSTGHAQKAAELGARLLEVVEELHGPEHGTTAGVLNNLGNAYAKLGDYQKQIELLERSLKILEQCYGAEHLIVATNLNNLGCANAELGYFERQKEFLERSLKIKEQHYGAEHPEVAATLNNLGNAYGKLADHQKQKELLECSLKIKEQHCGAEHPEVAGTLNNLGSAYGKLGNYQKEKELLERSLKINEQYYGAEHPDVAITLNNLGSAYGNLGDYQKKNELLERSLKIMEQYYGAEHLEVAKTLNNLGSAYGELGDYQKEKELLERSLKIKEQHYGAEHPEVAKTLTNLGSAHGELGDHQKQKELLEHSLKIIAQHYGAEHPEVAITLNNLGSAYGELGDHQKQKEFLERSLKILEQHHGAEHPQVAITLNNLGLAYAQQGDRQKGKELCKHALMLLARSLGQDHPWVATVASALANLQSEE